MTAFEDRLLLAEAHLAMHGDPVDAAVAFTIDELPPAPFSEPEDLEALLCALLEKA